MGGYGALVWFRDRDFILLCLAKPLPFPLFALESGEGAGLCRVAFGLRCYIGLKGAALYKPPGLLQNS